MKLTKTQRAILFAMFDGHCAYCGCVLPDKGWHADHIEPVYREWWKAHRPNTTAKWDEEKQCIVQVGTDRKVTQRRPENDKFENHFPACAPCNIDKGPCSLKSWRTSILNRVEVCRRNDSAFRHAERFGRVTVINTPVVFYFEQYALDKEAAKL